MKTVTARGLVNGRGPNRRFGRDSVFKGSFIPFYGVVEIYSITEPATTFATNALSLTTLPLSAGCTLCKKDYGSF